MQEQNIKNLPKAYRVAFDFLMHWLAIQSTYKGDIYADCAADAERESRQFKGEELALFSGIMAANMGYIERKVKE